MSVLLDLLRDCAEGPKVFIDTIFDVHKEAVSFKAVFTHKSIFRTFSTRVPFGSVFITIFPTVQLLKKS